MWLVISLLPFHPLFLVCWSGGGKDPTPSGQVSALSKRCRLIRSMWKTSCRATATTHLQKTCFYLDSLIWFWYFLTWHLYWRIDQQGRLRSNENCIFKLSNSWFWGIIWLQMANADMAVVSFDSFTLVLFGWTIFMFMSSTLALKEGSRKKVEIARRRKRSDLKLFSWCTFHRLDAGCRRHRRVLVVYIPK